MRDGFRPIQAPTSVETILNLCLQVAQHGKQIEENSRSTG